MLLEREGTQNIVPNLSLYEYNRGRRLTEHWPSPLIVTVNGDLNCRSLCWQLVISRFLRTITKEKTSKRVLERSFIASKNLKDCMITACCSEDLKTERVKFSRTSFLKEMCRKSCINVWCDICKYLDGFSRHQSVGPASRHFVSTFPRIKVKGQSFHLSDLGWGTNELYLRQHQI